MKLSRTQRKVLTALNTDKACLHYMRAMGRFQPNAYYYFSMQVAKDIRNVRESTVRRLLASGYIEKYNQSGFMRIEHEVRITPAGRASLASAAGEKERE